MKRRKFSLHRTTNVILYFRSNILAYYYSLLIYYKSYYFSRLYETTRIRFKKEKYNEKKTTTAF